MVFRSPYFHSVVVSRFWVKHSTYNFTSNRYQPSINDAMKTSGYIPRHHTYYYKHSGDIWLVIWGDMIANWLYTANSFYWFPLLYSNFYRHSITIRIIVTATAIATIATIATTASSKNNNQHQCQQRRKEQKGLAKSVTTRLNNRTYQ